MKSPQLNQTNIPIDACYRFQKIDQKTMLSAAWFLNYVEIRILLMRVSDHCTIRGGINEPILRQITFQTRSHFQVKLNRGMLPYIYAV